MTLFYYVCSEGHRVTAPWKLERCPGFTKGASCVGLLQMADSAFRRKIAEGRKVDQTARVAAEPFCPPDSPSVT